MGNLNRRDTLRLGGAAIAALASGATTPAFARTEAEALVAEFTGGKKAETAGLVFDIPQLSENASAVPATVRLEQAFSAGSYCEEILVVAPKNPRPMVCRFKFTPKMGLAHVTIRMRLGETQEVIALARLSDGRILMQRKDVAVTIGGCNG